MTSPGGCSRSSAAQPDVVRDKEKLAELCAKLALVDVGELARELETGEFTLRDIIDGAGRAPSATRATIFPSRFSRRAS